MEDGKQIIVFLCLFIALFIFTTLMYINISFDYNEVVEMYEDCVENPEQYMFIKEFEEDEQKWKNLLNESFG